MIPPFPRPGGGGVPTDRYAPDFRIEVEGSPLDPATKGDVLDLKVTMDMEAMTSVDLTLSNWNDRDLSFKYSDGATLDIGNRIHVQLGYADRLVSLMRGQISSVNPRFPQSGAPTLGVGALDGMQLLKDRRPAEGEEVKYVGRQDWQIAEAVAVRNGLRAEVTREGPVHDEVVQKNQDDAQFLMERAKRIDFDCYIHTDPKTEQSVLRFMRPTDERAGPRARTYPLAWGESLISFSPTLTISRQVAKMTVRGWNNRTKQAIVYTADRKDLEGGEGSMAGPQAAERALNGRQDVVVDAPVASLDEARELAISLLRERAYEFITGSGETIGMPELRPGDNLDLQGLGRRFSGLYYVKRVEHQIGSGGFTTRFDVRRVFDGGTRPNRRAPR